MKEIIRRLITKLIPTGLWLDLRQRPIIARHARIAELCRADIEKLSRGEIPPISLNAKHDFGGKTVIWQYWGQGWNESELPEVVRLCAWSVDRYKGDCIVVRLSDSNLHEYIDLPDYVMSLRAYNMAFFADMLRLALLATYGGVWLDATVLLTAYLPENYQKMGLFVYQRSDGELDKNFWRASYYAYYGWHKDFRVRMLNSIIFAQPQNPLIVALYTLLDHYWQHHEQAMDYFFFQIYFNELVSGSYGAYNCPIVNDCSVHVVQNLITGGKYCRLTMQDALESIPLHKLTYKGILPERLQELKQILNYQA
ncbi:MAG: capsular polysaccharide synthesis protein [Porphyromonadaceae bacterium]|nr:capsular polysaccharide synthesis protein [Porphyromonadaceae bacterium]